MSNQQIYLSSQFVIHNCLTCNLTWAMTRDYDEARLKDHKSFYCPNGHAQQYLIKSDEEKLKEQLKHCRADRDFWEDGHDTAVERQAALKRSRSSLRGVITRMKKAKRSNGQEVLAEG